MTTTTLSNNSMNKQLKICAECRFFKEVDDKEWRKYWSNLRCTHPLARDLITGEATCCHAARGRGGPCGEEGNLFEPQRELVDGLVDSA